MTGDLRPRVFVSSVSDGFTEFREAARRGIEAAGGEPILFEDFPSLPVSSRTACLDGVQSSDVFVLIVGERGGFTTAAGRLVVEEEWEEAKRCKLPVLVFLQDRNRDADASRLASALTDYSSGMFRTTFSTPDELATAVGSALRPVLEQAKKPHMNPSVIEEKLQDLLVVRDQAVLRMVVSPERADEIIDPGSLDAPELKNAILALAHSTEVGLMSYERGKSTVVGVDELVILQGSEGVSWRDGIDEVRLEVSTQGVLVIDSNVTGRCAENSPSDSIGDIFTVSEEEIALATAKALLFTKAFFDSRDEWRRYQRLLYNAALSGLGHRSLISGKPAGGSYPMGRHDDAIIPAFSQPRLITRGQLEDAVPESEAVVSMFRRRLKSRP